MTSRYHAPKLPPQKMRAVEQGQLDFLVPGKAALLTIQQAAQCLSRSRHFVYQMVEEGRLETFSPLERDRAHARITRRSLLLLMAEQANFRPDDLTGRIAEILATLTGEQYQTVLQAASDRRAQLAITHRARG